MMVYLMELVGDVLGWVELEVFWAGWRCLEVFWAGLRCCGLFPIDDFDIIRRYATRREMLRNVEKMSRNVKMSSFVQVANYWGDLPYSYFRAFSRRSSICAKFWPKSQAEAIATKFPMCTPKSSFFLSKFYHHLSPFFVLL